LRAGLKKLCSAFKIEKKRGALMKFQVIAIIAFALVSGGVAHADYKSEYKAYMAAIDAGDAQSAMSHADAAWRAAEGELGDHATTAILAYNFANLVSDTDPESAAKAYDRALAITEAGIGSLPAADLRLRGGEARLRADPDNAALADALIAILGETASQAEALADPSARAWRTIAAYWLGNNKSDRAKDAADAGIPLAANSAQRDNRLYAELLLFGGVARVSKSRRTESDIIEAVSLFDAIFPLFPPQQDIDSFDSLLGLAMAWQHSIWTLTESVGGTKSIKSGSRLPTGEDLKAAYERAMQAQDEGEVFTWREPRPEMCKTAIVWKTRDPPEYPMQAIRKGYIGAVIIGYDLTEDGVLRTKVLGEVNGGVLSQRAVESMSDWKLMQPPPPACAKNNVVFFGFTMV
jgi:hypothetical protein